jgi:ABC-type transport system involved in multi-copper enzyme maturation permease subunit
MSESFTSLFVLGTVLIGLQELAMLPWMAALGTRTRQRLREPKFWLQGVGIAAAAGLVFAFFMHESSDPRVLARWGRFYMSVLHLQLAADFFVLVYVVMLAIWPKGGAVALAAFREGVRQPMFWLLLCFAVFLMVMTPFAPYFTFGEDIKMVREICYVATMLFPALLGVVAASMSVHEEIEGRTAVTLMSKPISRRQFLLGKFVGILSATLVMTLLLGWLLVYIVLFKQVWDPPIASEPIPDPAWVVQTADHWFPQSAVGDFVKGIGSWINDAGEALPGLLIGFCQVMVLVAVAVALATRVPMVVNVTACLVIYFLGHLTAIMTEVSRGSYALINFVAQLFDTVLPGLDLFDVGTAIVRDVPLPFTEYSLYAANVAAYGITYTAIALLFGLILFEDRDLA